MYDPFDLVLKSQRIADLRFYFPVSQNWLT